ncbi:MAG: hypothetical protein WDN28_14245 [Chthoniobacter sp.]
MNVEANGTITVSQANTVGVLAYSTGGDGGTGGDSGFARNSKDGGAGGTGGAVSVTGNGIINTSGLQSTGILALSSGGNGGSGGDGGTTNGASNGGAGGEGGTVDVNGSWTITTVGDQAHGIWAKSLGGYAGQRRWRRLDGHELGQRRCGHGWRHRDDYERRPYHHHGSQRLRHLRRKHRWLRRRGRQRIEHLLTRRAAAAPARAAADR